MKKLVLLLMVVFLVSCKSEITEPIDYTTIYSGSWESYQKKSEWFRMPFYMDILVEKSRIYGNGLMNYYLDKNWFGENVRIKSGEIIGEKINFSFEVKQYDGSIQQGDFRGRFVDGEIYADVYMGGMIFVSYFKRVDNLKFVAN